MQFKSDMATQAYKELTAECGRISGEAMEAIKDLQYGERATATVTVLQIQFNMMAEAIRTASDIELQSTHLVAQATMMGMSMGRD